VKCVELTLPYVPASKKTGQQRGYRTLRDGRRVPAIHANPLARSQQNGIGWASRQVCGPRVPFPVGPVEVRCRFVAESSSIVLVSARWDIHNAIHTILDGMRKVVYHDDCLVARLVIERELANGVVR
jgi:hypothetical protein